MIVLLKDDYTAKMLPIYFNSIYLGGMHELIGGNFTVSVAASIDNFIGVKVKIDLSFTDRCQCSVKNKCNLDIPIIISQN